jgi:hypothetical protein
MGDASSLQAEYQEEQDVPMDAQQGQVGPISVAVQHKQDGMIARCNQPTSQAGPECLTPVIFTVSCKLDCLDQGFSPGSLMLQLSHASGSTSCSVEKAGLATAKLTCNWGTLL